MKISEKKLIPLCAFIAIFFKIVETLIQLLGGFIIVGLFYFKIKNKIDLSWLVVAGSIIYIPLILLLIDIIITFVLMSISKLFIFISEKDKEEN